MKKVIEFKIDKIQMHNATITGIIGVKINGEYFPEEFWDDFVVIVLNWWGQEFLKLLKNKEKIIHFRFMEGPFMLRLGAIGSDCLQIVMIDRSNCIVNSKEYIVSTSELKQVLINAIELLVSIIEKNCWESQDIETLKKTYSQLKKY
jgi:hypothetical protein